MDDNLREQSHKKNNNLELIFPELEKSIGKSELDILDAYDKPQKKVYLIVGCARSGSTLLYQYLSKTGVFVYPTNFLSRFYYAPYLGYRLQQVLIDFDEKGEVFNNQNQESYKSVLGKTKGAKEAHEFWYFWNRFFSFKDLQILTDEEIQNVDWTTFLKELHALESAANKPILLKAMNLNFNLLDLYKKIPNVHFIYIKRDVVYNAQSLLQARQSFFGNTNQWYSFKTPNYHQLKKLSSEEQVVEQVLENNSSIEKQLSQIDKENQTTIRYSDFCKNPSEIYHLLNLKKDNIDLLEDNFKNGNIKKISDEQFDSLVNVYESKKS